MLFAPQSVKSRFKDKKHKQPLSPVGKLANFPSSLFHHQTVSKKKSKSFNSIQPERETVNNPESMASRDSKSIVSSASRSSGLKGPPPYPTHPTKEHQKSVPFCLEGEAWYHNRKAADEALLAERAKSVNGYALNRCVVHRSGNKPLNNDARLAEVFILKEDKCRRRGEEEEDGEESDSSSDQF
ncbi:hypothetical protein MUK42_34349 [Musa troglodytarum]|uniref:Uncharacterized protein n=1 Tax=Musa troglodytarum TaxID=320322 RepID=A0A9E7JZ30_9LILI|nr:hypothetical protein MUK42_34349 [Musa troglodytarum]